MHLTVPRTVLLAGGLLLAACGAVAPAPPAGSGPTPVPAPADDTCGAAPHAALVGQPATALERVLILRQVRLIRPGTAVTEDFVPARINFHISAPDLAGVETVTRIACG